MTSHDKPKQRLKDLERKLAQKRDVEPEAPHGADKYSQAQVAWRMVTELVAGLGIGFGIGYGLDHLFGTTPLMMILFIFLGFAAGIKTVIRSARDVQVEYAEQSAQREEDKSGNSGA